MKTFTLKLVVCVLFLTGTMTNTFSQSWVNVGSTDLPEVSAGSTTPLEFSSSGEPYIAFSDYHTENKITVMKFDGTDWITVGQAGFSPGPAYEIAMKFSNTGELHVAFKDWENSYKASVMKFDGTDWVMVGQAGFSENVIDEPSIAFSSNNEPYVAYIDRTGNQNKVTVTKFDGTDWITVGQQSFSEAQSSSPSLAFDNSEEPYVAYSAGGGAGIKVVKFDGNDWITVGTPIFPGSFPLNTSGKFPCLVFNNGTPYVAFKDWNNNFSKKVAVMQFDGTDWVAVGQVGFSSGGEVGVPFLAFNNVGEPYVSFQDWGNSHKANVMKFDGTDWVSVGQVGFSEDEVGQVSLAISNSGEPYVAFSMAMAGSGKMRVMKYGTGSTGVKDFAFENSLLLYPNPANEFVILENLPIGATLNMTDITGKTVYSSAVNNEQMTISTADFVNGVYIIQVVKNGVVSNKKLIVNK